MHEHFKHDFWRRRFLLEFLLIWFFLFFFLFFFFYFFLLHFVFLGFFLFLFRTQKKKKNQDPKWYNDDNRRKKKEKKRIVMQTWPIGVELVFNAADWCSIGVQCCRDKLAAVSGFFVLYICVSVWGSFLIYASISFKRHVRRGEFLLPTHGTWWWLRWVSLQHYLLGQFWKSLEPLLSSTAPWLYLNSTEQIFQIL